MFNFRAMRHTRAGGKLGLTEAIAIGIGGMVGGGIFSVLGLSARLAGGGAYISFALGGLVALATGYSYAHLGARYPSQGGTVEYLNRAFGEGQFAGSLNSLLWLGYIVMLSLYAYSFGAYGSSFWTGSAHQLLHHVFASAVIILFTAINLGNANLVGEAEDWLVAIKLLILGVFVAAGLSYVDPQKIAVSQWAGPGALVGAAAIIFLAYEGFELIANSAEDLEDAGRQLHRALYWSIGLVMVIYVVVSLVAVGNLTPDQLDQHAEYALALAARPSLGEMGFILIAAAALISTASAINATLYGAARNAYTMARDRELPLEFETLLWGKPVEGLLITSALSLVIANSLNLSGISLMGSAAFLLIFAVVNFANYRLRHETGSHPAVPILAGIACLGSFVTMVVYELQREPRNVLIMLGMLVLAGASELLFGSIRRREDDEAKEKADKSQGVNP